MQSPTRISWSGCLSSCSLNKWPSFPQANTPTYGSQNISSNSVTGWDDEGAPMYIFWSLHHRWWQGLTFDNLWHHRWCRLQKMYIGHHHQLCVSKCWPLQEFCIHALCLGADIFLIWVLTSIFEGISHHWWPFCTFSELALLVTQGNS